MKNPENRGSEIINRPKRTTLLQRIRVPLGFVFGLGFLVFAQPVRPFLQTGMACAFLGLSLRVWAAGHLHKHKSLATQGPYRWTRNPLYLGSFIMGLGFMVAASEIFLFLLFICLFLLIYIPVMRREEGELVAAYGEDYTAYKARVPLLFPSTRNWPKCEPSNFSWHQVILNREYKAVLGFCLITVFLVLSAVD